MKRKGILKLISASLLCLGVGVATIIGATPFEKPEQIKASDPVENPNTEFFRVYVDVPSDWSGCSEFKIQGNLMSQTSLAGNKFNASKGEWAYDIDADSYEWDSFTITFKQSNITFYPNTSSTGTLGTSTSNCNLFTTTSTSSKPTAGKKFKPGYVYTMTFGWYKDFGGNKYYTYYFTEEKMSANNNYQFLFECSDFKEFVFLKPNKDWLSDGARFAGYFFGNGETWVSATDKNGDGIYEILIPKDKLYPSIIMCRMNGSSTANNWDNRWNQSSNLTLTGNEGKQFDVTGWSTGEWETRTSTLNIYLYNNESKGVSLESGLPYFSWPGKALNQATTKYNTSNTLYAYTVVNSIKLNTLIISNEFGQSSNISFSGDGVYEITFDEGVPTVKSDEYSADKLNAYKFMIEFNKLTASRINNDICKAVDADVETFNSLVELYNSFDHATYVDSIEDNGASGVTIQETMSYLMHRYPQQATSQSLINGVIVNNSNNNALIIVIISLAAVTLLTEVIIYKRKHTKNK